VILLLLALLGLAHGGLVGALAEASAARAAVRELRLRAAADRAVVETLSRAPGPWMDSVGPWGTRSFPLGPVDLITTRGTVRRLSAESWWIEGVAESPSGAVARAERMAWSLDPLERVKAMNAAVVVGTDAPVSVVGTVDVGSPAAVAAPMDSAACDPWQLELQDHFASAPLSVAAPLPESAETPGLGLLDLDRLIDLAPDTVVEAGTPLPLEASAVCLVGEPWVWGDPDLPSSPCGEALIMRAATADLRVEGGVGQGIVVVDGDLTLVAGARFYGMILAGGALRLTGGSTLEGMAIAAGGLDVGAGSTLRASACWAVRALEAQRELLGAFIVVGQS
jgi:hypothetical protein